MANHVQPRHQAGRLSWEGAACLLAAKGRRQAGGRYPTLRMGRDTVIERHPGAVVLWVRGHIVATATPSGWSACRSGCAAAGPVAAARVNQFTDITILPGGY